MRPASILRSSPFRLALAFGVLFMAAFTASSFIAFQSVRSDLLQKLDRTITDTYSVIVASYGDGDLEDLVASLNTHARISSPEDQVFLLTGPNESRLAGNVPGAKLPVGWSAVSSEDVGLSGEESYRVFVGEFDGNRLVVGMSYAETDELQEIALASFGWASLIVLATALAGGIFLAFRVQRRMEAIAGTMMRVSHGELGARIPLIGSGDDIDTLSIQVNSALERLAALVEGMRQVSADIAHDLKTPLNRLKLIVEAAIENEANGHPVATELAEARAESDQINATFDALLRIAQIESGARKSRFTVLDLGEVVASIAEVYVDVAFEEGRLLVFELGRTGPLPIFGDRELLLQLFSNLVENTIRHCPDGTRIEMTLAEADDKITAAVNDNGPGIPENEQENVLRRLYRLDKSRTTSGTGLGLSLVKAIAELHGASLELGDNEPGLRVTLTFPKFRR